MGFVYAYDCLVCYGVVYCLLIVLLFAGLVYILARFICFGCGLIAALFLVVGLFIVDCGVLGCDCLYMERILLYLCLWLLCCGFTVWGRVTGILLLGVMLVVYWLNAWGMLACCVLGI